MRIISLVPSLTETAFDLGLGPDELVGRTPWCIHPAAGVARVPKVGGTKTPNVRGIIERKPDLVLLDREENPKAVYDELVAAGVPVFVSTVERVAQVPSMLRALGLRLGKDTAAEARAAAIELELAEPIPGEERPIIVPLIWHEPLMAVGPQRYAGDLIRHVGFEVPDFEPEGNGYPKLEPADLVAAGVQHLALTSEPHAFTKEEGEALVGAMVASGARAPHAHLVDGEALTWFGARTLAGLRYWRSFRMRLLGRT